MSSLGQPLWVPPAPGLGSGATIPAGELTERFSRSPGPGGQSVNTSDSRVELVFAPATSTAFSEPQLRRILSNLEASLINGTIVISANEHRSQLRNRTAARERLVAMLRSAVAPPAPVRRPTKPTRGSQRRRIEAKKRVGQTKALRGRVRDS